MLVPEVRPWAASLKRTSKYITFVADVPHGTSMSHTSRSLKAQTLQTRQFWVEAQQVLAETLHVIDRGAHAYVRRRFQPVHDEAVGNSGPVMPTCGRIVPTK